MYSSPVLVGTYLYMLQQLCTVEQLQDLMVYFPSLLAFWHPQDEMEGHELNNFLCACTLLQAITNLARV